MASCISFLDPRTPLPVLQHLSDFIPFLNLYPDIQSILGEPAPKLSPHRQPGPLPEHIASLSLLPVSAALLVSLLFLQARSDWKEVPMGLSRMWQAQSPMLSECLMKVLVVGDRVHALHVVDPS